WSSEAPIERISSVRSGDVDANPSSRATVIGKNVTSTTPRILGRNPNPTQRATSGAIATIGIVWLPTSNGATARRTTSVRSIAMAAAVPATIETAKPTTVSPTVGRVWRQASSRHSQSEARTRDGGGSTNGLT